MASNPEVKLVGEVTDVTWNDIVTSEQDVPVFVDFWAPWCGPCKMVGPVVEQLAEEYDGRMKFVKLNTDENPTISQQFSIRSIPTLAVFFKGEAVHAMMGAGPLGHMREFVDASLEKVPEGVAVTG
jgi:thioredoxin 1